MKPPDEPLIRRALGAEILRRRKALGLLQRQVWERAGLAKNVYLRLERAERNALVHQLIAVAIGLDTTAGELLGGALDRIARGDVPSAGDEWRAAFGVE
ncbi:helix-turn-helix domain-containing protein [Nocardia sp. CA-128927]|uniref:helix-turn-helix domain-containing protein n=1 Tax=Nocardia sp. CA-128927 TaxID=3239975 RepID=UPI003D96F18C